MDRDSFQKLYTLYTYCYLITLFSQLQKTIGESSYMETNSPNDQN
ncbi:unknown [Roseburia sp. CAG:309]|nr:unknown [Roseburia sp. CAG:309]